MSSGYQKERRKCEGLKKIFKKYEAENFQNLAKHINLQTQKGE
jgi:hypothetical protein